MTYDEQAPRTESLPDDALRCRMQSNSRLLHGAMGLATEAGELMDQLKKNIFYGKELDLVNIEEELGDLEWYMAIIRDVLGVTQAQVQEKNIAKLRKRYPEKFTSEAALNRDLDAERAVLEEKVEFSPVWKSAQDHKSGSGMREGSQGSGLLTSNELRILIRALDDKYRDVSPSITRRYEPLYSKLEVMLELQEKQDNRKKTSNMMS